MEVLAQYLYGECLERLEQSEAVERFEQFERGRETQDRLLERLEPNFVCARAPSHFDVSNQWRVFFLTLPLTINPRPLFVPFPRQSLNG